METFMVSPKILLTNFSGAQGIPGPVGPPGVCSKSQFTGSVHV